MMVVAHGMCKPRGNNLWLELELGALGFLFWHWHLSPSKSIDFLHRNRRRVVHTAAEIRTTLMLGGLIKAMERQENTARLLSSRSVTWRSKSLIFCLAFSFPRESSVGNWDLELKEENLMNTKDDKKRKRNIAFWLPFVPYNTIL